MQQRFNQLAPWLLAATVAGQTTSWSVTWFHNGNYYIVGTDAAQPRRWDTDNANSDPSAREECVSLTDTETGLGFAWDLARIDTANKASKVLPHIAGDAWVGLADGTAAADDDLYSWLIGNTEPVITPTWDLWATTPLPTGTTAVQDFGFLKTDGTFESVSRSADAEKDHWVCQALVQTVQQPVYDSNRLYVLRQADGSPSVGGGGDENPAINYARALQDCETLELPDQWTLAKTGDLDIIELLGGKLPENSAVGWVGLEDNGSDPVTAYDWILGGSVAPDSELWKTAPVSGAGCAQIEYNDAGADKLVLQADCSADVPLTSGDQAHWFCQRKVFPTLFELDGNAGVDKAGRVDWVALQSGEIDRPFCFAPDVGTNDTDHELDGDEQVFKTSGTCTFKLSDPVDDWCWEMDDISEKSTNIQHAYYSTESIFAGSDEHVVLYLGVDRLISDGDLSEQRTIFWLLQDRVELDMSTPDKFKGSLTDGDLALIVLTNGSAAQQHVADLVGGRWNGDTQQVELLGGVEHPDSICPENVEELFASGSGTPLCLRVNTEHVELPWLNYSEPTQTPYFLELAVDLTQILRSPTSSRPSPVSVLSLSDVPCFASLMVATVVGGADRLETVQDSHTVSASGDAALLNDFGSGTLRDFILMEGPVCVAKINIECRLLQHGRILYTLHNEGLAGLDLIVSEQIVNKTNETDIFHSRSNLQFNLASNEDSDTVVLPLANADPIDGADATLRLTVQVFREGSDVLIATIEKEKCCMETPMPTYSPTEYTNAPATLEPTPMPVDSGRCVDHRYYLGKINKAKRCIVKDGAFECYIVDDA